MAREFIEGQEYLCGLGDYRSKKVEKHKVGRYHRGYFSFSNGADGDNELAYKKSSASNAFAVLTAKIIK